MEIDDDSHYDTPWEFKNRAIVAALSKSSGCIVNGNSCSSNGGGINSISISSTPSTSSTVSSPVQQQQQQQFSTVYTDENQFNDAIFTSKKNISTKILPKLQQNNSKMNFEKISPVLQKQEKNSPTLTTNLNQHHRMLSKETKATNSTTKTSPTLSTVSPQNFSNNHRRNISDSSKTDKNNNNFSTFIDNFGQQQQQQKPKTTTTTTKYSRDNNRISLDSQKHSQDPCPLMTVSTTSSIGSTSRIVENSTENSAFSKQKHQQKIPNSSTTILNTKLLHQQQQQQQNLSSNKSYRLGGCSMEAINNVYPLVSTKQFQKNSTIESSSSQQHRNNNNESKNFIKKSINEFDENLLIHEGMERVQAEQLLKAMDIGDYLLRRRNEGNLALSLRSIDGILHIKLEFRDGYWVLGEGPRFSSVGGMLRCYRKTELPVRGAERVRLKTPITTSEVAFLYVTPTIIK